MAEVASYFNTNFRRIELVGVVDVQTIMDAVKDELTVQLPVGSRWTEVSAYRFQSPPQDPAGANRYFFVVLSRISATRIQFLVQNREGSTVIDGRCDIAVAGSSVKIWSGDYHLAIESSNLLSSVPECCYAVMLDPTPFGLSMTSQYVIAMTNRNTAGTGANDLGTATAANSDALGITQRIMTYWGASNNQIIALTAGGAQMAMPVYTSSQPATAFQAFAGIAYQMIIVDSNFGVGAEIDVQLSDGTEGTFEVISRNPGAPSINGRLAIRKA